MHAHTHAHTHACTHAPTHARTHTQTPFYNLPSRAKARQEIIMCKAVTGMWWYSFRYHTLGRAGDSPVETVLPVHSPLCEHPLFQSPWETVHRRLPTGRTAAIWSPEIIDFLQYGHLKLLISCNMVNWNYWFLAPEHLLSPEQSRTSGRFLQKWTLV